MCVNGRPETQLRKRELLGRDLGGGSSTDETRASAKALGQGQTLQVPRPGLPGLMGRETVETQREPRPHKVRQKPASGLWPLPHHLTLACAKGPSRRVPACGRGTLEPTPPLSPLSPRTSWDEQSRQAFVTSPDDTVTNGFARSRGHKAGSGWQMFEMMREWRPQSQWLCTRNRLDRRLGDGAILRMCGWKGAGRRMDLCSGNLQRGPPSASH